MACNSEYRPDNCFETVDMNCAALIGRRGAEITVTAQTKKASPPRHRDSEIRHHVFLAKEAADSLKHGPCEEPA
jgi:hypothetical protein